MLFPYATVRFHTDKPLEEVSHIISRGMLGGISFGGRERTIWGDIPAVYSSHTLWGLRVELGGYPGPQGYELRITPDEAAIPPMSPVELDEFIREECKRLRKEVGHQEIQYDASVTSKWQSVDLSEYLRFVMESIQELKS